MLKEINDRRSIRNYKQEEISKDDIIALIESAIKAPSAKNNQPWHFIVLNKEIKDKIGNKMIEEFGNNKTAEVILTVPYLVLIYNTTDEYFNHLSIGACIENFLLEATSRDLGTLWIGYIKKIEEYVKTLVNCDFELVSAIAVGVKNENPISRPRKDFKDVVTFID